jgi:hypothetical protein
MAKFERSEIGTICLVQETEDGRIIQIGLTPNQNKMLQMFLASISKDSPLVKMSEDFDVVLKRSLCKKCKTIINN